MPPSRPAAGPERRPAADGRPPLEIHRSVRRRRSSQAAARDGVVVVRLPAGLPVDEEEAVIGRLVTKVARLVETDHLGGDAGLAVRAEVLADRYLDGVRATSVRWSTRMARRYGSCSTTAGDIRISSELARMPSYVRDAVLVHELAHLQVASHSPAFWALARRFPATDRAIGYLAGFTAGRLAAEADAGEDGPVPPPRWEDDSLDAAWDDGSLDGPSDGH